MRVSSIVVTILLSVCASQTVSNKPPEPDSIGVLFYLDSTTQTLKRLPIEDYKKHRGTGWAKVTDNVKVQGTASSFRIPDDKPAFVFKVFKDEEAGGVLLFRFDVKGKDREYELGKWKRRDFTPNRGLPVDVAKFGDSSYRLVPNTPLEPGEYALTYGQAANEGISRLFTFAVSTSAR